MASWGVGWFGGGQAKKKDAPKNAILQLRSTLEMLNKREKHLQNQMDEQDNIARKYVNTNKAQAKAALRRKKQFEHSLEQTSAQMMTIEREIGSIETANINKQTLDAMQNAASAMKTIHGGLTVDKVDNTMEDLREQHAIGEEIAETLTSGALMSGAADEDELDEELAELQQEELDNKMLKTGTVPQDAVSRLPEAARNEPTSKTAAHAEDDEEEDLKRLQAEMAI